jgi:K+-transporting ATPase ATPase C chain
MFLLRELRPALSLVALFTLLTGFILPELFTGAVQLALPFQANGSLLTRNGQIIGSALIGQNFTGAKFFQPRPSALDTPYDAGTSGASNLAPSSAALLKTVQGRVAAYQQAFGPGPVPADAVTASGSGLDPDISLANALHQAPAVAAARHLPTAAVTALVNRMALHAFLSIVGTDHLNVLRLNLALEQLSAT